MSDSLTVIVQKPIIKYPTSARPRCLASVCRVRGGVWYVCCDFFDQYEPDASGADDQGNEQLYFSRPQDEDIIIEVTFPGLRDGLLFGGSGKKSYHGTFYPMDVYSALSDKFRDRDYHLTAECDEEEDKTI